MQNNEEKKYKPVINWVDHREQPVPYIKTRNSHRDPTADLAIGNILREEKRRRKKHSRKVKGKEPECYERKCDREGVC